MEGKKLGVIMCCWQRMERLKTTFNILREQTFKDFTFYIWNNNPSLKNYIDKVSKKYSKIDSHVHHCEENVGGVGRFMYAQKVADKHDVLIFIDDDQNFPANFLENMLAQYEEKTLTSWFAFTIESDYYNRRKVRDLQEADYCGTGGLMADPRVFKHIGLFDFPDEFQFVEDLWLSYFAKYVHGYKLRGANVDVKMRVVVDGKDQSNKLKETKIKFWRYLENRFNKQ